MIKARMIIWKGFVAWSVQVTWEIHTTFWSGNVKGKNMWELIMRLLTLKQGGCYLNFSSFCLKNMEVAWTEKDEIVKQHLVENKTEIMQHVLEIW